MFKKTLNFLARRKKFVILFLVIAAINWSFESERSKPLTENKIVKIIFDGELSESSEVSPLDILNDFQHDSYDSVRRKLDQALHNKMISGVFIQIKQSTAIGLAQAQELSVKIQHIQKAGKKVYAFAENFGGFGANMNAYLMVASADKIYLQNSGIISMNGYRVEVPFYKKLFDKYGFKTFLLKREEFKSFAESYERETLSDAARENYETIFKILSKQYIETISKHRKLQKLSAIKLFENSPYFGESALSSKLVDKITNVIQAENDLKAVTKTEFIEWKKFKWHTKDKDSKDQVALVYLDGPIMSASQAGYSKTMNEAGAVKTFKKLKTDKNVKAVVVRINSPGGDVVSSEVIRTYLKDLSTKKPVVVSMGNICASGGYYIATAGQKIIAQPGTLTGSIGVVFGKYITEGLFNYFDIHHDVVQSNENADFWSTRDMPNDEQKKRFDGLIDYIYENFLKLVKESRGFNDQQVIERAKGRVWTGMEAHNLNLVDDLGGVDKAFSIAVQLIDPSKTVEDYKLITYPKSHINLDRFYALLSGLESISTIFSATFLSAQEKLNPTPKMQSNINISNF